MRLNYLDYQIVYLEDTGDVSVYKDNKEIGRLRVFSVGGGSIKIAGEEETLSNEYESSNFITSLFDVISLMSAKSICGIIAAARHLIETASPIENDSVELVIVYLSFIEHLTNMLDSSIGSIVSVSSK